MNQICMIGRLAGDPEMKYTKDGKAVCNFRLAVNRGFGDNAETDWIPITAWEKQAEFAANFLAKGRLVSIEGRLQSRTYEKDGATRTAYDVVARNITALGPKPADTPESRQTQRGAPEPAEEKPAKPVSETVAQHGLDLDPNDPFAAQ